MPVFDYVCVYNPELGDESCVEKQLVYTSGPLSTDEFLRAIGVAQGLAELAYSFDEEEPAHWFDKTCGDKVQRVYIVPLNNESAGPDWRKGYWGCCQETLNLQLIPPEIVFEGIKQVYYQFKLFCSMENSFHEFKLDSLPVPDSTIAAAPNSLRMAPGALSPAAADDIRKIAEDAQLFDVLVTLSENSACVFPGTKKGADLGTLIQIQRWLASESAAKHFTNINDIHLSSSEPSLASNPLIMNSLRGVTSLLFGKLNDTATEPVNSELRTHPRIFIDGKSYMLSVYMRNLFTYTAIVPENVNLPSPALFESFAEAVEGFSFAFSPPVGFQYLLHNTNTREVVSTLPAQLPSQILPSIIGPFTGDQQIARTAQYWVLYRKVSEDVYALVLKPFEKDRLLLENCTSTLYSEVQTWIEGLRV